jgi:hypothetical protein
MSLSFSGSRNQCKARQYKKGRAVPEYLEALNKFDEETL